MTDKEKMELAEKVLGDSAVIEKLMDAKSTEEAKGVLAAEGLTLTDEEMDQLGKTLDAVAAGDGELSEDQLEDVAGGILIAGPAIWKTISNAIRSLMSKGNFSGGSGFGGGGGGGRGW